MPNSLWTVPFQSAGKIIRATAALAAIPLEVPPYAHGADNKKPEFLAKFPHGKIPAFESADGVKLFEGTAIARYIAGLAPNSGLLGNDPVEAALVDQWTHLADSEIETYTCLMNQMVRGVIKPYNKPIHTIFAERQLRSMKTLNTHLATRTYFVGERITLADLTVAATIQRSAVVTLDTAVRAACPHLVRHMEMITSHPKLHDIYGKTVYIEKAAQYVPPEEKKEVDPAAPMVNGN